MIRYVLYRIGQFLVNRLPLKIAYRFATCLSDLQYMFSRVDRRSVSNNLKSILKTEADLSRETRQVFRNFGLYLVEFFRIKRYVNRDFIKKNVTLVNLDILDRVRKENKGGILITGHLGNWELGSVVLSMLGYPSLAIALPHKDRLVNDLFNGIRAISGNKIVPTQQAVRRCLEELRNNNFISLAVDRDFSQQGEVFPFLGKQALIPKGAAIFSGRTGAPLIPIFFMRNGDGIFTLTVEEPIYPPRVEGDIVSREVLVELMGQYKTVIEKMIYKYPTQWLMFRQFWVEEDSLHTIQ